MLYLDERNYLTASTIKELAVACNRIGKNLNALQFPHIRYRLTTELQISKALGMGAVKVDHRHHKASVVLLNLERKQRMAGLDLSKMIPQLKHGERSTVWCVLESWRYVFRKINV